MNNGHESFRKKIIMETFLTLKNLAVWCAIVGKLKLIKIDYADCLECVYLFSEIIEAKVSWRN